MLINHAGRSYEFFSHIKHSSLAGFTFTSEEGIPIVFTIAGACMRIHHLNCSTCCLLIETFNGMILVDTGEKIFGQKNFGRTNSYFSCVLALGIDPGEIRHIVLRKEHVRDISQANFPRAQLHVLKPQKAHGRSRLPVFKAYKALKEGFFRRSAPVLDDIPVY